MSPGKHARTNGVSPRKSLITFPQSVGTSVVAKPHFLPVAHSKEAVGVK